MGTDHGLVQVVLDILQDYVDKAHNGKRRPAAIALGITPVTFNQWMAGKRLPSLDALSPVFDKLGISISRAGNDASRDVKFINATPASGSVTEGVQPPDAEDYIAAPLVGEAGAGPGYLPEDEIKSWFLAYKNQPAIRYRKNLIAVEIGKQSRSMLPTLAPGDIVLVDRDDRDVSKPGHMMLVLDPLDGSGMVKRVSVEDLPDGDSRITYYSDNAREYAPVMYSLREDFGGDWDKAIVGRVIWGWADIREK